MGVYAAKPHLQGLGRIGIIEQAQSKRLCYKNSNLGSLLVYTNDTDKNNNGPTG